MNYKLKEGDLWLTRDGSWSNSEEDAVSFSQFELINYMNWYFFPEKSTFELKIVPCKT